MNERFIYYSFGRFVFCLLVYEPEKKRVWKLTLHVTVFNKLTLFIQMANSYSLMLLGHEQMKVWKFPQTSENDSARFVQNPAAMMYWV